ncbi:hypothetical protein GB937_010757 [Aspergillus fischeri]|nr:hypothetical protein GB937_010757 [Aspergillus fischeri]
MPRNIRHVVDTNLMVYGTANVCVVDASVFRFQLCGHLMSTLYAVAERAADITKAENRSRLTRRIFLRITIEKLRRKRVLHWTGIYFADLSLNGT